MVCRAESIDDNPGCGIFLCYAKNILNKKRYYGTSFISKRKARALAVALCKEGEKIPRYCKPEAYDQCVYRDKRDMDSG